MLWHAFLCPCTARTAVPAPRGCLRRCRRINLPPCEKMCPSTQDLLRVRGVRAVSLLPSRLALSLPAALRSHPFTNSPDSIMWQLLFGLKCCRLPCPEAEGVSEPSQDHLETTRCLTVWRTEAGAAAKTSAFDGTWRQRWPSRSGCLKLAIPSLDSGVKDRAWRCRFDRWNTFHRTSTHYGPSCKVACSSRKPWTSGTLVLGLSQAMLLRSGGALCKPVSPQSEPIHAFLQRARAHFPIVFVRAKGSCLMPWMILLCRLSLRSESALILRRKHVIM